MKLHKFFFFFAPGGMAVLLATSSLISELQRARDMQDHAALDQVINRLKMQATPAGTPDAQYQLALAYSYAAELSMEQRDKKKAEDYAEAGMDAAKKAVDSKPDDAEYHRLLGDLCGQVIPANPIFGGMKYGQCARDEVNKALQLDPNLALAYVSRGVGNYYLPESFGGGIDLALKDFDKAIALNPKLSDAYLWKGIALRKVKKNSEARQALAQAVQLSPDWQWAKEQLQKTPAQ
ncbi:MAG: tetratricopeptide repeat protein [Bryobacteraceae bacterium]